MARGQSSSRVFVTFLSSPATRALVMLRQAVDGIVIRYRKSNLLGRPQPRKESELVVVALGFAPVVVKGGDQRLRILDAERVNRRAVPLGDACAAKGGGRVAFLGIVLVAEGERLTQGADGVVVSLPVPVLAVGDADEHRIPDAEKGDVSNLGPPDVIENLPVRRQGDGRQVAAGNARFSVVQEGVKYVVAGAGAQRERCLFAIPVVGEFLREAERPGSNAGLNPAQVITGTTQIRFGRYPGEARAKASTLEREIELDAVQALRDHSAGG